MCFAPLQICVVICTTASGEEAASTAPPERRVAVKLATLDPSVRRVSGWTSVSIDGLRQRVVIADSYLSTEVLIQCILFSWRHNLNKEHIRTAQFKLKHLQRP